ncbi:virulence RhuM family protein [Acetobacter sacchari]|uniref:Virulence RhuM family protein n=1 Tax=Acetobacter sacchari TaxID=2661687 RepID=A0ABS3M0Q4_9PROT|nr:virulence RhuM family protein [Acetobacter sacchari]
MSDSSQFELTLAHYETPECSIDFKLDEGGGSVWATQAQIADAFGISSKTVSEHLANVFREQELIEEAVVRKIRTTAKDGKSYNTLHYNLDAILSVGYRVSGTKATKFRQWATGVLKSFLTKGYALNEERLRDDPESLKALAAKIRALRADEKNIYKSVRDVFAFGSIDYDKSSPTVRSFYAKLQDKLTYAVTGNTSAQIVLTRASSKKPNMGLKSFSGAGPGASDIHIGKNYLEENELYQLHILCEQFLMFMELSSAQGKALTMQQLADKFDALLIAQDQQLLSTYDGWFKDRAKKHAEAEYATYRRSLR